MTHAPADPREIYGGVAELYAEFRPSYPAEMVEDVIRESGIPADGRILEVGCGPGKATVLFAPYGRRMTCIDPVPEMLDVARRQCSRWPDVEFVESTFEDFSPPPVPFDLVYASQSFHWVRPEIGYSKAGTVVRPGGKFALWWTEDRTVPGPLRDELSRIRRELAPDMRLPTPGFGSWSGDVPGAIAGTGLFEPATTKRYPWTANFDVDSWIKLELTSSNVQSLPLATRDRYLDAQRQAIVERGGVVDRTMDTVLFLARRLAA